MRCGGVLDMYCVKGVGLAVLPDAGKFPCFREIITLKGEEKKGKKEKEKKGK